MPDTALPPRARWRQALRNWALRKQRAAPSHLLRQRNIYVLPSAAGWALALTLLVLLIASINFQLNLGYALTFLLAGSAVASVWMGHRNLRGVALRLGALQPIYQGEQATVPVILYTAQGMRQRHGLSLAMQLPHGRLAWVHSDVPAGTNTTVELGTAPRLRGWHRVPRIVIESRFPLGVFRLWSYWQPDDRVLVYPAPESPPPPLHLGDTQSDAPSPPHAAHSGSIEHDGVRSYQRGDALRTIAWKKTATALASGSGDLVVRHSSAHHSTNLWLEARATGLADPEAQIARLTAWVLHAHAQQWKWGLRLPSGLCIQPATGTPHLHACLVALAVDGQPAEFP